MNRKYSLKKSYDIEKLIKVKQSVGNKYYAIYYQTTSDELLQIAFSISKRLKTAVQRNYEKKVLKEIFRKNLERLNNFKMLIVVKESASYLTFSEKEVQVLYLINKMVVSNKV